MVPAYEGFELVEPPLEEFTSRWLPGLDRDGLRISRSNSHAIPGKAIRGHPTLTGQLLPRRDGEADTPPRPHHRPSSDGCRLGEARI